MNAREITAAELALLDLAWLQTRENPPAGMVVRGERWPAAQGLAELELAELGLAFPGAVESPASSEPVAGAMRLTARGQDLANLRLEFLGWVRGLG